MRRSRPTASAPQKARRRKSSELLNKTVNAALADPAIKARLEGLGGVPNPMSPAQFRTFIAGETAKWAKVLKFANIKMD